MLSLSFLSTSRLVDPVSLPNLTSRITQPSPSPIPLPLQASSALQCQHFQSCSGCSHEWNLDRPIVLDDAEKFFKRLGISDFSFDSGRLWEWRCRAKLAVRGSSDNPLIGLYEEGTHNVVDIPQCRAHHPKINATVELLRQGITSLDVQPYDEDQGTGELRYVQMAVTTHNTSLPAAERYKTGKVQVTLVWNSNNEHSPSTEKLNALSYFLWRHGGPRNNIHLIHSIWVNFQTSSTNIIFGNRWRHLLGEKDLWEHIGGIDISLAPSSFGQANTQAFDSLLRKLQKYVPYGASVADIYAGAGIIGLSLAVTRKCRSVKCIEINKESKLSFEKSIGRLPKSVDSSISWHHADASVVGGRNLNLCITHPTFMIRCTLFALYLSCTPLFFFCPPGLPVINPFPSDLLPPLLLDWHSSLYDTIMIGCTSLFRPTKHAYTCDAPESHIDYREESEWGYM